MIKDEPLKTKIKQPESHFRGEKSHPQILRWRDHFPKCRKFGIAILGIFVKIQSFLRNGVARSSTWETF